MQAIEIRRLLVVDDEKEIRAIVRDIAKGQGIEIVEAGNGREALEAMKGKEIHAVLCDINMPSMNGFEFLNSALSLGLAMPPVAFITAYGEDENLLQALRLGAVDFVQKPFDNEDLLGVIVRILDIGIRRKRMFDELRTARPDLFASVQMGTKMISLIRAANNKKRSA